MSHCIEIQDLNQFYGKKQALHHVTLSIQEGMFGLLGRNGAGKTTLMKTLATLLPKRSGHITVCGIPIEDTRQVRSITGYLPQEFSLYPSMNVKDAMNYLALLAGLSAAERKKCIPLLLERVNLTEHQHKKVKALSGGMKRRLGIAQALLNDPQVLIVDEPTAGLDPEERVRFRNLLSEIAENRIVILSTHIVGDIEAACEDIAIINEGSVIYTGTVSDLIKQAKGRVFTISASKRELPKLKRQLSITSMHTQGEQLHIRFIANTPPQGASLCDPNIEDAYMLYLHQNDPSFSAHAAGDAL